MATAGQTAGHLVACRWQVTQMCLCTRTHAQPSSCSLSPTRGSFSHQHTLGHPGSSGMSWSGARMEPRIPPRHPVKHRKCFQEPGHPSEAAEPAGTADFLSPVSLVPKRFPRIWSDARLRDTTFSSPHGRQKSSFQIFVRACEIPRVVVPLRG